MARTVLLTGAAGNIGEGFREEYQRHYRDAYQLRLAAHDAGFADARFDDVVTLELAELDSVRRACRGVDTVIHLAANPSPAASFCEGLLGPNVVGNYHLFEAARLEGCRRVVFASSVHAILGYPADYQAHVDDPPRPDCLYGVTKVFGEGLCAAYAHEHALSCIAVRIGAYTAEGDTERLAQCAADLDMVVTQRDMAQLLHRCVEAPDTVRYAIVNGLSDNRFKRMDLDSTRALLGYAPQDDAFAIAGVKLVEATRQ